MRRVVVEWTRSSLRVAAADGPAGRLRVRTLHVEPLGMDTPVGRTLERLVKKLGLKGALAIGMIPRDQVISRLIKLPATQPEEVTKMVELYGKAQLPYPKEQAVVDHHVLDRREGFSTVAVVACRRDAIDRVVGPLKSAGLAVERLTVSSWGVLGWYAAQTRPAELIEPVLIVNRDEERVDLVLVAGERVLFSRSVGAGTRDGQEAAEGFEELAQELDRSLSTVRKELPGTEVRSFLVSGMEPLGPWAESIQRRFGLPVVHLRATQGVFWRPLIGDVPVSPIVVCGAACADAAQLLNLTPPELIVQARQRQRLRDAVLVGSLAFAAVALGAALLSLRVARQRQLAAHFEKIITELEPVTRQVKAKQSVVQLVSGVVWQRHQLAGLLAGILRLTPEAVSLEALTFEEGKRQLLLRGRAPSTEQILAYLKVLEQLDGVAEVRLQHSTRRSTPGGERADFELLIQQSHAAR